MATVKFDKFGGLMPRAHPSLLPDGMATAAHNCRLKNGKLVPLREPSFVDPAQHTVYCENGLSDLALAKSLYCWKHTLLDGTVRTDFLAFPGRVHFAHGNIADDSYDRIFVTGETGISFTTASGDVKENCPAAYLFDRETNEIVRHCICKDSLDAPRCTLEGDLDESDVSYAYFFLSWFDRFGYESEASEPSRNKNAGSESFRSEPLKYSQNSVVRFQGVFVPTEAYGVRVYKTNSGNETDNIQFLREFSRGELSNLESGFTVRVDDTQVGEAMPEIEPPPYDLVDMTFVPGNYYAGRARSMPHTVLFSDVDNPTNWATAYRYDVRDNVVRVAVTSNSVFALTDGVPYVLSGTAPESMTVAALATPAACVSERSVFVHRNAVYFASNRGLFVLYDNSDEGTACKCVTEPYITKDQWLALNPSSCVIGGYDDALHLFFTLADGSHKSMIIDFADGTPVITTHEEASACVCMDDRTDDLYFNRMEEV